MLKIKPFYILISLLLVACIQSYFSFSKEAWMLLTTYLALQTSSATPIQHALYSVFLLILAVIIFYFLESYMTPLHVFTLMTLSICLLPWVLIRRRTLYDLLLSHTNFLIVLGLGLLATYHSSARLEYRVWDIGLGGLFGMLLSSFFLPRSLYEIFIEELMTNMEQTQIRLHKLAIRFSSEKQNMQYFPTFYDVGTGFPDWVYEAGFNPKLRAGFRFFLVHWERVEQLIYLLSTIPMAMIPQQLHAEIRTVLIQNANFMTDLKLSLNKKTSSLTFDMESIERLEENSFSLLPDKLELFFLQEESVPLALCVRYIRELQETLSKLAFAIQ